MWDPTYWEDFRKLPGYLGADSPESRQGFRIQQAASVKKVVMADEARKTGLPVPMAAGSSGEAGMVPAAFVVESLPKGDLVGASLILKDDKELYITGVHGDAITVGYGPIAGPVVNGIKAGDEVRFDNSTWLAFQTYHRHQVPPPEDNYYIFDQFRGPDTKPLYPQRPELVSLRMNEIGGGSLQSGRFAGKMIMVETLMDEHAAPWNADWYRSKVQQVLGSRLDEHFRLWHVDHALHSNPMLLADNCRVIRFTGILEQALRDVSAWAEKGVPPAASTSYKVVDSQIEVPSTAAGRKGIQPVVTLTVNGGVRADVKVGEAVKFSGVVEVPPNTGKVMVADWDFEGTGDFPVKGEIKHTDAAGSRATISTMYTFIKPGTYFPVLRAGSQRTPDGTPYARALNLDRVRVVAQ